MSPVTEAPGSWTLPGEGGREYHSIRIIYRTVIDGGTLVSTSILGMQLAYGERR